MKPCILAVTILILAFTSTAFATCPNQVTTVAVQAGAPPIHVTVTDQNCQPLDPAKLGLTMATGFNGILTIAADATGFNLSVANINQPVLSGIVTFKNTANLVSANLGVNTTPGGVTKLNFTSP